MNMLLHMQSKCPSFSWEISFSKQIFDYYHRQCIDVIFSKVKARDKGVVLSDFRCEIVPSLPSLCLDFKVRLKDIKT